MDKEKKEDQRSSNCFTSHAAAATTTIVEEEYFEKVIDFLFALEWQHQKRCSSSASSSSLQDSDCIFKEMRNKVK